MRVQNPEVFEARNRRTLELIAEGRVTGVRIDHIDGLFEPVGHMRKLQLRLASEPQAPETGKLSFYVVIEKILASGEVLPGEFPVSGTTGYDFLDSVNAVFVDPAGLERLTTSYRAFTGIEKSFADICYERKKQVISELFAGEMRTLGKQLSTLAMADRNARDFSPSELLNALTEITACLQVYRTYIRDSSPSAADQRWVAVALSVISGSGRSGSGDDATNRCAGMACPRRTKSCWCIRRSSGCGRSRNRRLQVCRSG